MVISRTARNLNADDLVVIPIFSRGGLGPTRVLLPAGTGGLHHDSLLFCEEITTIHRELCAAGPLGPGVARRFLDEAILAVRRAIGDVV